jgi:cysteinyl-tRNA synthetase
MLKIYNSLAREKQMFTPIVAGKVSMYVCGMTVYDYCHLGHARVMVVFDMVYRWLCASGLDVTYVRNITDIDDKIIKRANENNETIQSLTQRFITAMDEDSAKLGVLRPNIEPRATEYIQNMLDMIAALVQKGHAYQASNGDVYYAVNSFASYGQLSGKSLEDLRAGERVEVDTFKRDAMDFVLWKSAKPNEPSWPSPWGNGRPGWHIECSAMGAHHLGQHFDIHGGGLDLQFPHHENEIAQSEGAHDCKFVNYWMHNGFVRVVNEKDGQEEKMSKSLGNFFTIRDVLKQYDAEVVRFFILRAHYRSPLNYSEHHLDDAKQGLTRLYTALRGFDAVVATAASAINWQDSHTTRFKVAMDDDFNTAEALAVLFELANDLNKHKSADIAALLKGLAAILGLLQRDAEQFLQANTGEAIDSAAIADRIEQRRLAKQAKNFAEADRIRRELTELGIILEDTPQGTTWRTH